MLAADGADRRWLAASVIERMGTRSLPLAPALLLALEDPDARVRASGARSLGQMGSDAPSETAGRLVERLRDDDPEVRGAAAEALSRIGGPAVPAIIAAHPTADAALRSQLRKVLSEMPASALDPLSAAARKGSPEAREVAVVALGDMAVGLPQAVPPLVAALSDASDTVRAIAAAGLARLGTGAVPAILVRFPIAPPQERVLLLQVLGGMGAEARGAVAVIRPLVLDPGVDLEVRLAAIRALGRIGPKAKEAVPTLKQALSDPRLRQAAGAALAEIGS
jgi:HEAT repeat protein